MIYRVKTLSLIAATACVAGLLFSSCEGNLQPRVYASISPENFPQNESDVKTAVTAIYHDLRKDQTYGFNEGCRLTNGMSMTDEFDCNWGWTDQVDFLVKPESNFVQVFYNNMMPTVTKATRTIEIVKNAPISQSMIDRYVAELRCIRAIIAWDLYDMYGPVPIVVDPQYAVDPQKAQDYFPPRPSKEEYVDFLEKEFKEISEDLPVSYQSADYGRMTKGAALTALLKLYMHEKEWQKALDVTQEIMDLDFYELQKEFTDIWSPANEQNKEIIWAIPNISGAFGNWYLCNVLPSDYVSRDGIALTKWSGWRMPWPVWDSFEAQDKRREPFVRWYFNGSEEIDGRVVNGGSGHMARGSLPMKYPEDPDTNGSGSSTDLVLYRYADVLLYRAEVLNEVNGGPTQEAVDIVNSMRRRGGVYEIALADFDQTSFRDRILQERQWELCFEGWRRQDLIRHGKFIENALARGKHYADDKHLLLPIPQSARNENKNLEQNPDY